MVATIRIALCQLNLVTGDFEGNFDKAEKAISGVDADLFLFPAHQVGGPGASGLYNHPPFLFDSEAMFGRYQKLAKNTGKAIAFGTTLGGHGSAWKGTEGAVLIAGGQVVTADRKRPAEGEERWFHPGSGPAVIDIEADGTRVAVGLCAGDAYEDETVIDLIDLGAEIVVSPSSHWFHLGSSAARRAAARESVKTSGVAVVSASATGGYDQSLMDGRSFATDAWRREYEAPAWREGVFVVSLAANDTARGRAWRIVETAFARDVSEDAEAYVAACMGLRDYMTKTGFSRAVLGLSGGSDSALVALMAADVLGEESLDVVLMPSRYTSQVSDEYARNLAAGIGHGVRAFTVPIDPMVTAYAGTFVEAFGETVPDVAEENLQAQVRGNILSWHSNKSGCMILSTGNRSEAAMGYSTLYGDMRGGYNPLKDLYKTQVFAMLEMRHALSQGRREDFRTLFTEAFGRAPVDLDDKAATALRKTIDRSPSAELAEGQQDSDSLPDYNILDDILEVLDGRRASLGIEDAVRLTGQPAGLVEEVRRRMRTMEFKRFQACPGPRVHQRSPASDAWRFPMASAYKK